MVDAVLALPEGTRLMVLAPVVRDRKGEFAELFADMQAQGYVRFRVDGHASRPAALPKLKKTEKHDIDVVIDRVKRAAPTAACSSAWPRASRPRCASPTAAPSRWRWTPARAPVLQQVRLPGVQLLAARTGAAAVLVQLAGGRLPACDGLGQVTVFDPERVVAFPS
jgi:excinuclease ABC subunit A